MRCVNHPDRVTARSCELCGRAFCDACLSPAPMGAVCATCAPAVEEAALPPPEPVTEPTPPGLLILKLVGEALYGLAVALPLVVGVLYALDVRAVVRYVDFLYQEPRRFGDVAEGLVRLGGEAERQQVAEGPAWDGEAWMEAVEASVDPYSLEGAPYQVVPSTTGMRLCSVGPDRKDDRGAQLDRFTALGDLCVELRTPALLQVR